jgi:hypothetical protein
VARTTDQIARSVLGNQLAEIIAMTAEIEALREEVQSLRAEKENRPNQTPGA